MSKRICVVTKENIDLVNVVDAQNVIEEGLKTRRPQVARHTAMLGPQVAWLSAASGPQVVPRKEEHCVEVEERQTYLTGRMV